MKPRKGIAIFFVNVNIYKEKVVSEGKTSRQELEEYKILVEQRVKEIEGLVVGEGGEVKVGAIDALTTVLKRMLANLIDQDTNPKELLEAQLNNTVGHIAGACSDRFHYRHGVTLFGLAEPTAAEEITEMSSGED